MIKIICDVIKKYRRNCGYTQKQLADLLNIDRSTYAYYESGRIIPDVKSIMKLCKIFNIDYEEMLGSEPREHSNLQDCDIKFNIPNEKPSNFMDNLTKKEQEIILYYRLLPSQKKEEIRNEILKKLNNPLSKDQEYKKFGSAKRDG